MYLAHDAPAYTSRNTVDFFRNSVTLLIHVLFVTITPRSFFSELLPSQFVELMIPGHFEFCAYAHPYLVPSLNLISVLFFFFPIIQVMNEYF